MANKNDKISFEDTLSRLEEICTSLENGNVTLSESLDLYNEGIKLLKSANQMLDSAEKKIKSVKVYDDDAE